MEEMRNKEEIQKQGTKVHIPSQLLKQYEDLLQRNLTGLDLPSFVRAAFDEKRSRLLRGIKNAE